jgi:hypothetical protein
MAAEDPATALVMAIADGGLVILNREFSVIVPDPNVVDDALSAEYFEYSCFSFSTSAARADAPTRNMFSLVRVISDHSGARMLVSVELNSMAMRWRQSSVARIRRS